MPGRAGTCNANVDDDDDGSDGTAKANICIAFRYTEQGMFEMLRRENEVVNQCSTSEVRPLFFTISSTT